MREYDEKKLLWLMRSSPERGLSYAMDVFGGAINTIVKNVLYDCPQEDVEECISECFFRLWKDIHSWDEQRGLLKSWFYGIARHTAIDFRRKIGRNFTLPLDETVEIMDSEAQERFMKQLTSVQVRQAVNEMEEPDRTVFILRYFWYFSYEEIAERTGLTAVKVKNILYRSKKGLRETLIRMGVER